MKTKEPREVDMHAQFELWERDFQKMQSDLRSAAKAAGLENSVKNDLDSLHAQMKEAWNELDRYDASGEAWDDFRIAFDEVWKNLKLVVNDVVSRHKHKTL